MTSGFNLKGMKKLPGIKNNYKNNDIFRYSYLCATRGVGGLKIWKTSANINLMSWSSNIQIKLNELQSTFRKHTFLTVLFNFEGFFLTTIQFRLNISAPVYQIISDVLQIF